VPTYEYRCKDCDHGFDVAQSFSDPALTECPSCGGALRKVFGNVGITFKGSGFYKTDSRSSTNGTKKDKDKDKKADGDSSSKKESSGSDASSSSSKGSGDSKGSGSGAKSDSSSSTSAAASA
jgi:putative FmdB family regulatory protein